LAHGSGGKQRAPRVESEILGAGIYIREAQYNSEKYAAHRGWGHGTFDHALEAARDAGVATLVIYHLNSALWRTSERP
jgi:ribonuclease BN (tRNA processing enzyme)